jgi:hypothetical protein
MRTLKCHVSCPHENALLKNRIKMLAFSEKAHETVIFDYNVGSGNSKTVRLQPI